MDEPFARYYRPRTVLVTGGAGAIGSNLVKALVALGVRKVIVIDDLSSGRVWNLPTDDKVVFLKGSVTEPEVLRAAFKHRPSIVFHLAALFANQNSIDHPEKDLMVNGMGTLAVLRASASAGVDRFVFASSGCAFFEDGAELPVREQSAVAGTSTPYQITKALGEAYCEYFYHRYHFPTVRARLFNVFGPGEVPGRYRNVIPNFLFWALNGRPLKITGTGDETRDFTWVGDIVAGLLRAGWAEGAIGEAINLASGQETKVRQVAEIVLQVTGSKAGIRYEARRDWDHKTRLVADISKAMRLLGYRPGSVTLEEGIRRTMCWMKENWERIVQESDLLSVEERD